MKFLIYCVNIHVLDSKYIPHYTGKTKDTTPGSTNRQGQVYPYYLYVK